MTDCTRTPPKGESLWSRPVADVVAEDYRRAPVFKGFGIDFCCKGSRTVRAACEKRGVEEAALIEALRLAEADRDAGLSSMEAQDWPLDSLLDYIEATHHGYARRTLPQLRDFAGRVAKVHGHHWTELHEVRRQAEWLVEVMEDRIEREGQVFSWIRGSSSSPPSSSIISLIESDNRRAQELMGELRRLTANYTPPEGACNTYQALYANLAEFEEDLRRYTHLLNDVLGERLRSELPSTLASAQRKN